MATSLPPCGLSRPCSPAALALSGCGGDDPDSTAPAASSEHSGHGSSEPDASGAAAATVDVTIEGDEVTPVAQAMEIGVGETVLLNITSDRSGELHVHSSPEQEFEFESGTGGRGHPRPARGPWTSRSTRAMRSSSGCS